jgi:hypothetical protein
MIGCKRVALVVLAAGGLLASCGGSGSSVTKTASTTGAAVAAKGTTLPIWDENRKMNDVSGYSSPLASALGQDFTNQDPATMQGKFKEQEQKRQDAVAECMRAQGWTYTPYVQDFSTVSFQPPGYDLTRKEYVEKYGFGIATSAEESNNQSTQTGPKPEDNPNFVYQQTLSPSDSEAYNKALYGSGINGPGSPDETGNASGDSSGDVSNATASTVVMTAENSGCQGAAMQAMNGGANNPADKAFVEDFQKRLSTLFEKVQSDARVVAANRAYATCMAGKGYPEIDKPDTAQQKVSEKMNAAMGSDDGSGSATAATVAVAVAGTAAKPVDGANSESGPPPFDPAKLAEVKTYELGVAKADLACGTDVLKTSYEVQHELEKAFVEQNKADVARYKEVAVNGGRG